MSVRTDGWCRIEGANIADLLTQYGNLSNLSSATIYYGHPAVEIYNKTSPINGIVYKVVPLSEFGYESISEIDKGYSALLQDINSYNKTINLTDTKNAAQYYYESFTVEQSSVIFYADTTELTFSKYAILYVDEYATPHIVSISAKYVGNPVPIGDKINLKDDVKVTGVYEDGNTLIITTGYTIEPSDLIVTHLNSNTFTVSFADDGKTFTSQFVVQGVKKLIGIEATYSGPNLTQGDTVLRRFLSVIAKYSDNTSGTVTDYSFPDGNVLNASGELKIYYKGFYTTINITMYTISTSRLMAYYNGPNIEVGHNFDINNCKIKIYYQSSNGLDSKYEDIPPSMCEFLPTTIDHEGTNFINVTYEGKAGKVTTQMIVIGIKPEVKLNFIEASYTGPEITVGKSYSLERVIVKAHYSDGSVVNVINGFSVNTNIIKYIGENVFVLSYTDKESKIRKETTFTVIGLEKDSTTETNYSPISLNNHYPEATRLNNRYRGPAEGIKHNNINYMIFENIKELYNIFQDIELNYNQTIKDICGDNSVKYDSLNTTYKIEQVVNKYMNSPNFSTGIYIKEEKDE